MTTETGRRSTTTMLRILRTKSSKLGLASDNTVVVDKNASPYNRFKTSRWNASNASDAIPLRGDAYVEMEDLKTLTEPTSSLEMDHVSTQAKQEVSSRKNRSLEWQLKR